MKMFAEHGCGEVNSFSALELHCIFEAVTGCENKHIVIAGKIKAVSRFTYYI